MRITLLYGPPGVGKYTTGKAVAEQTGALLFHNHLLIDLLEPFITRSYPAFSQMVQALLLDVLRHAVKARQKDLIVTFAYSDDEQQGRDFMAELASIALEGGANFTPIYLACDLNVLLSRVEDPSRAAFGKLMDRDALLDINSQLDLTRPWQGMAHHSIDTTRLSAPVVADRVVAILRDEETSSAQT